MRRRARTDGNHRAVIDALRQIPGVSVADTSRLGQGFPDCVVGYRGMSYLLEIKDPAQPPSKRRLTPDEQAWFDRWRGHAEVVETIEQALKAIGVN